MKRGRFDHGTFIWSDGRRQDAFEALLEEKTGAPVKYPEAPYEDYVVIRGRHVAWRPAQGYPGVQVKHLGHFTEVGPHMQLVRMSAGSRTPAGRVAHQEIRCVFGGRVRFADEPGQEYGETTLRYIPPGVEYGATECLDEATIIIVRWAPDGQTYVPAYAL
jgi:hypothetical protein